MPRFPPSVLLLAIPLGCTSVLGIDGDYVGTQEAGLIQVGGSATGGQPDETGGVSTGGVPQSGGGSSGGRNSGGAPTDGAASGGAAGSAGGAASCDVNGASCPSGQKCCPVPESTAMGCIDPLPLVGCERSGCTPCPPPPSNGIAICAAGQCDFECSNGTTRNGNACESSGAGGTAGAGGAAGTGGVTVPPCEQPSCRGCGLIGPFRCCRADKSCGCTYAPGAVCY
jgi:hypothetical protein